MSEHDEGTYTCHAVNEIGEAKHNFQVASELQKLLNAFNKSYKKIRLRIKLHQNYIVFLFRFSFLDICFKLSYSIAKYIDQDI